MVSRFAAFVIWAAVAASVAFWSMRLLAKPSAVPAHATLVATSNAFKGDLSRIFGVDAPASAPRASPGLAAPVLAEARFQLIGVVAPRSSLAQREGLALIALDGKPAKAFRVGAAVDGDMVLQAVHARGASLGPRGQVALVRLELPALPAPTSTLLPTPNAAPPPLSRPPTMSPGQTTAPRPSPSIEPPMEASPASAARSRSPS
jgi:general secretion pathway protein C